MRMVTRCPRCGTAFRVYSQQLAVRNGHVRCGQCATVFDAREALVAEAEPQAGLEIPGPTTVMDPPPPPADRRDEELARTEALALQSIPPSAAREPEISHAEADPDFEFGPVARRAGRRAAVLWGLASLVALLALAGQLALAYRADLAAIVPATRPWLERGCLELCCTVPLPTRAELVSIESSELHSEPGATGVLTLSAVIRNRAAFPQALPAIELTLTDAQDRPVARRVLAPREYLGDRAAERPFAANGEHAFKLHIDTLGLNASGYRMFLFYR